MPPAARPMELAPSMAALALLVLLSLLAGPAAGYLERTSAQLFDRAGYVGAVLGTDLEG
jgi:multicomponent K+:H+ antiporter subunit D